MQLNTSISQIDIHFWNIRSVWHHIALFSPQCRSHR